jgi:prenyltransferase beta subunit
MKKQIRICSFFLVFLLLISAIPTTMAESQNALTESVSVVNIEQTESKEELPDEESQEELSSEPEEPESSMVVSEEESRTEQPESSQSDTTHEHVPSDSYERPFVKPSVSSEESSSESPVSANETWTEEKEVTLSLACDWLTSFGQGELYYLCMGAAGIPAPARVVTKYIADVSLTSSFEDVLSLEYTILNATFCGYSAENVLGKNLIDEMGRYEYYDIENANVVSYALLALDSNRYMENGEYANNRATLIDQLLLYQNADGGFGEEVESGSSSVQTALALTALAPYAQEDTIAPVIQKGLQYLQRQQQSDGTFLENGAVSSVAVSKTIIALISLGIPLTDSGFMKEGETLDQVLMRYVKVDGGFSTALGQSSDNIATENAILAMIALKNQRSPYLLTTRLQSTVDSAESAVDQNGTGGLSSWFPTPGLYILLGVLGIVLLVFLLIRLFWRPQAVLGDESDEWIHLDESDQDSASQEDTEDKT